jgi:hypothetical protein
MTDRSKRSTERGVAKGPQHPEIHDDQTEIDPNPFGRQHAKPPNDAKDKSGPVQPMQPEKSGPIQVMQSQKSGPIQVMSMKTPGVEPIKAPIETPVVPRPKLRAMSEITPLSHAQPRDLGYLAPPRDPAEVRSRRMRDLVLWSSVVVIVASVVAVVIWFLAR